MNFPISDYDVEKLDEHTKLKDLYTNAYLSQKDNDNYKYIKEHFFPIEDDDRIALLNVGSGMFTTIADIISYYVGSPSGDIDYNLEYFTKDYVALGYCCIGLERVDGELAIKYLPAENYYNYDGLDRVVRFYVDDDSELINSYNIVTNNLKNLNYYILLTTYGPGYIENKLYKNSNLTFNSAVEVPLDTLHITKDLLPYETTGLQDPAIVVVQDDDTQQDKISMFDIIKNIVYSMDRKAVLFETQFLKHTESFILLKNINIQDNLLKAYSEGKKLDFNQIGRILLTRDPDAGIEFINNKNELIQDAIAYEEKQIRKLSSLTTIPTDFLGLPSDSGNIGKGSRGRMHGAFIKKIQSIRDLYDRYLKPLNELMVQENGLDDDKYTRPDIFSKDDNELIDELNIAINAGLISKKTGIMRYLNYTSEEAEEELENIKEENEANKPEQIQDLPFNNNQDASEEMPDQQQEMI